MRLLEIVRGKATSTEVIATSMALAKRLKKVGVLVGNCRGFVGNRMFHPYRREAQFLVEEGAPPAGSRRRALPIGAWRWDRWPSAIWPDSMSAGAFAKSTSTSRCQAFATRSRRICSASCGTYGQKTRAGWYRYDDNRTALPDPDVERLIAESQPRGY